jgi:hypothetical protein
MGILKKIAEAITFSGETPTDVPGVYINNFNGRYFMKPEEYLKNPEAQRQMKQLSKLAKRSAREDIG